MPRKFWRNFSISSAPGILIEVKSCREEKELAVQTQAALAQIQARQYDTILKKQGIRHILKVGMAYCGRQVEIAFQEEGAAQ